MKKERSNPCKPSTTSASKENCAACVGYESGVGRTHRREITVGAQSEDQCRVTHTERDFMPEDRVVGYLEI